MVTAEEGPAALAELAERLRRARHERRLSMAALERRAGLGHTTVSRALNGSTPPSTATVIALAKALGLAADPLLDLRRTAAAGCPNRTSEAPAVGEYAEFEARYREFVRERHGRLSIVGLDLSRPERTCWPLDTAYLSLELAVPVSEGFRSGSLPGEREREVQVVRAERALADRNRALVRGLAGSGKTTLLNWLAVSTAGGSLPPELAHLADRIPFVLPLRTLVRRGELPQPEGFLTAIGCPFDAARPAGWADQVMLSGGPCAPGPATGCSTCSPPTRRPPAC
jgi:transcriptional regulator with XRE-family HTH domain